MARFRIPSELPLAWACSILAVPWMFTDLVAFRLLTSIPFLLVAPGLLLVTALFPRAVKRPLEPSERAEADALPTDPTVRHHQLALSSWERAGAILGASVIVLAIQGLALGWTTGISLVSILVTRLVIDLLLSGWLVYRWNRVDASDRFVLLRALPPTTARIGTVVLGLLFAGAAGALLVDIGARGLEPTTAFSVSSTSLMTHCLPESYNGTFVTSSEGCPQDVSTLRFLIGNREFRDIEYVLDVFWSDSPEPTEGATARVHLEEITLAYRPQPEDVPAFRHVDVRLDQPPGTGLQYLHGVLLIEGDPEPYRTVSLPITA